MNILDPGNKAQISAKLFQQLLLKWFDTHGRKHLPWQKNKTPYRVWVSEIMLQQTQVNTVVPYFERFIARFPDLSSLAEAKQDEVMHFWSGLGYYSRARNLQGAAKKILSDYHGRFPDTLDGLQTLPGIGASTAAAILSIAFDKRAAILDGNVKRVLCRIFGITRPINEKSAENELWQLAEYYAAHKRSADYTQAMMDLGATLCTRAKPNCAACPFQSHCYAYREDMTAVLPKKKASTALLTRKTTFVILKNNQQVLLRKRPPVGIWGGLWSFPELAGVAKQDALQAYCRQEFKSAVLDFQNLEPFRHTFTHFHLDIFPILVTIKKTGTKIMEDHQEIWYDLHNRPSLGLPKPVAILLEKIS